MRWLVVVLVLCGCDSGTLLEQSCGGEAVPNCIPYQYSVIDEASIEPSEVDIGDLMARVHIRVGIATCSGRDVSHIIGLTARAGADDDVTLIDVLSLEDDGMTEGDDTAGDGVIDIEIVNPFVSERLPENADVTLVFQARARPDCSSGTCIGASCLSEPVEVPFRLGSRVMP